MSLQYFQNLCVMCAQQENLSVSIQYSQKLCVSSKSLFSTSRNFVCPARESICVYPVLPETLCVQQDNLSVSICPAGEARALIYIPPNSVYFSFCVLLLCPVGVLLRVLCPTVYSGQSTGPLDVQSQTAINLSVIQPGLIAAATGAGLATASHGANEYIAITISQLKAGPAEPHPTLALRTSHLSEHTLQLMSAIYTNASLKAVM